MCGVCPGPFGEELSPPFVSNMSKAQRHAGVGGLLREAIRSQIGFVAARKAGGGFRREVQPRRQHWFLNEKSGFPFRTPAFCSVSRGRRRLGEKEYRAPSVTPRVALRPRTQGGPWRGHASSSALLPAKSKCTPLYRPLLLSPFLSRRPLSRAMVCHSRYRARTVVVTIRARRMNGIMSV